MVTLSDLSNFEIKQIICGNSISKGHKRMWFVANSTDPLNKFMVELNNDKVGMFIDLEKAIDCYNNL